MLDPFPYNDIYYVEYNDKLQQAVEQDWEQIKSAITEVTNEVIQTQNKKQRKEW
jgi:hypothetical protein